MNYHSENHNLLCCKWGYFSMKSNYCQSLQSSEKDEAVCGRHFISGDLTCNLFIRYNILLFFCSEVAFNVPYLSLNVQLQPGPRAKSLQLPPKSPGPLCSGTPPGKWKGIFFCIIPITVNSVFCLSYFPFSPNRYASRQTPHLCLSNMKVLVAVIDDGAVLAAGSDVANALYKGTHGN